MATKTDSFSPESWEYARGYAGVFGTIPSSFTSVIRSLMIEHGAGLAATTGNSKYLALRLLKSPSLFAPFYFACRAFKPGIVSNDSRTPADTIVKSFNPFELGYLLGLVYLTRKAQSLCDADEFKYLLEPLIDNSNIAFAIGKAVPALGMAVCMIEATAPTLGLAAFARHDLKGFKEYRREANKPGSSWDIEAEVARWGCNRLQIASVLVQTLGFGILRANALVNALSGSSDVGTLDEVNLSRDYRMAGVWREALSKTLAAPTIPLPAKYYPTKSDADAAIALVKSLRENPVEGKWLTRGKADLPSYQLPPAAPAAPETPEDEAAEAGLEEIDGELEQ